MKNIGILTGTRAEYGLLKPVMQKVEQDKDLNLCLIVTGMHLSEQFGYTYREIEKDGFDSIGGWMFFMLGMDIEINQSVDFSGYRFKVVEIDKFRVISIKIERIK